MVDETDNRGGADTTRVGAPGEPTVRLDRVIVQNDPTLPTAFGRYKVLDRIGVGGFASVYSAVDPQLQAPVAVKVLAENHSADLEVRRRFVAEARVARRLGSERLVNVFDVGSTDDGRPYVVMELADRGTLRSRLNSLHRPTTDDLVKLIEELGACLDAIHRKGVIHRDLKPSNLLLRSIHGVSAPEPTELIADDEQLVLADFGLARDISAGASALTIGGGTAGYMAPEQADPGGKADHRADLYAATVVLAELTTMRHPERLDLGSAEISQQIRAALQRGLALDRERRPETASAWRSVMLDAYRVDGPTELLDTATLVAGHREGDANHYERTKLQAPYPYGSEFASHLDPLPSPAAPDANVESGRPPPPPPPSLPVAPKFRRPAPAPTPSPSPTPSPTPAPAPASRSAAAPRSPAPRIGPGGSSNRPRQAPRSARPGPTPLPVAPAPPAPAAVPLPARPVSTPDPRQEAERQSKRHMKTAERLGRLEAKARRKRERKGRRRRRRRRRIANVFIGLIRGALAAVITFVIGAVVVSEQASTSFEYLPSDVREAVGLAAFVAFFLGIALFPLPRYVRN